MASAFVDECRQRRMAEAKRLLASVREEKAFGIEDVGAAALMDQFGTQPAPSASDLVGSYAGLVFACASMNAEAVSRVPVRLYVQTKDGQKQQTRFATKAVSKAVAARAVATKAVSDGVEIAEVLDHPLLDLLEHPNRYFDSAGLRELTDLYLETAGSAYWRIERAGLDVASWQIWLLQTQHVMPVLDPATQTPIAYTYGAGKTRQTFKADEIVDFHFPNLTNPYGTGWSPARAMFETINLLQKDKAWQQALLDNNARPDIIVGPKDENSGMGRIGRKRLDIAFNSRFRRGGNGGVFVPEFPIDVKQLSYPSRDMEAVKRYGVLKIELMNAYKIPPALFESNKSRAELEAALVQHGRLAIAPRLTRIDGRMTQLLVPMVDPSRRLFFMSDDPVPDDLKGKAELDAIRLTSNVKTINEARREAGDEDVEWGDEPLVPNTLVPISMAIEGPPEAPPMAEPTPPSDGLAPEETEDTQDGEELDEAQGGKSRHKAQLQPRPVYHRPPSGAKLKSAMLTIFRRQRLEALRAYGLLPVKGVSSKGINLDATPIDLGMAARDAMSVYPAIEFYVDSGAKRAHARIGAFMDWWSVELPQVRRAIDNMSLQLCKKTMETTSKELAVATADLKEKLAAGIISGENTPAALRKVVNEVFENAETWRADRIAVTESSRATHDGQIIQAEMSGIVEGFKYLRSADPCPICIAAEADVNARGGVSLADAKGMVGSFERSLPPMHPNCMCDFVEILRDLSGDSD